MTQAYGRIKKERHPEECPQGASRRTHKVAPTKLGHYPGLRHHSGEWATAPCRADCDGTAFATIACYKLVCDHNLRRTISTYAGMLAVNWL